MSVYFKHNLQTKLPRAFNINKYVIRITLKMRRLSDAPNFILIQPIIFF